MSTRHLPALWTPAMRDHLHETGRLQALAREAVQSLTTPEFLSLADRKAEQQRQMAEQAKTHGWR